jgi:hypothetical protein
MKRFPLSHSLISVECFCNVMLHSRHVPMPQHCRKLLPIMMAALFLVGCETPPQTYYPSTYPSSVTVTTGGYDGQYQFIKHVHTSVGGWLLGTSRMSNEEVAQELQRQAAAVGADMVINTQIEHDMFGTALGGGDAIKTLK